MKGYEVKKGKYISLKAPEQQRFVRTKTLGEEYTAESLASRILWRDVGSGVPLQDYEPSHLRDAYISVIGKVTTLAQNKQKVQRRKSTALPYSPQNDLDLYTLSAQLSIINRDHIRSIGELEGRIQLLTESTESQRQQINQLTLEYENLLTLQQQAELYFSLLKKSDLSPSNQVQLKICKMSMEHNQITTQDDLSYLASVVQDKGKKIAALKDNFKSSRQLLDVYSDIAKTYHEISKGDYVSRLATEERQRQESERNLKR